MYRNGFTLFELLITLAVAFILIAIAVPSLSAQINAIKLNTATQSLTDAIALTRTKAVFSNKRATVRNMGRWEDGWEMFIDNNNDGYRNGGEQLIQAQGKLKGVRITTTDQLRNYLSFISNGQGRQVGQANQGAMQIGTITVCPTSPGPGYALRLSHGGRIRTIGISASDCESQ